MGQYIDRCITCSDCTVTLKTLEQDNTTPIPDDILQGSIDMNYKNTRKTCPYHDLVMCSIDGC